MAFLIDETTRILVQGITGRQGRFAVDLMTRGNSKPVAGVTPGKGGESVDGIPVFDTVEEAVAETGVTASIIFVPATLLRDAALEAIDEGLDPIVLMVDGVPARDALAIIQSARAAGSRVIGPNTPGIVSPGRCLMAAVRHDPFLPGSIAVISRSGGMMTTLASVLTDGGLGQSTCLGVGGDRIIGLDLVDAAMQAEADPETSCIVVFGEVGTSQEHRLADAVLDGRINKPVVAYIAGVAAPPGVRYSHAGAFAGDASEEGEKKRARLAAAGVLVPQRYTEIPEMAQSAMDQAIQTARSA